MVISGVKGTESLNTSTTNCPVAFTTLS